MSASLQVEGGLKNDLAIDPFGSMPNWASRIAGLGGADPSPDPTYVFRTVPIRPGLGSVNFTIHFFGLTASTGTLRIDVRASSAFPGAEASPLEALNISLADLLAQGGTLDLRVACRRNTLYELAGSIIDESDVACSSIAITADRHVSDDEQRQGWRHQIELSPLPPDHNRDMFIRSWMTRLDAPSFDLPSSQGWSSNQKSNPHFNRLVSELKLEDAIPEYAWGEAFILRVLETYATLKPGAKGVGFLPEPHAISTVLAARETNLLLVQHETDPQAQIDPGASLENHSRPDLCDPETFYDRTLLVPGNWWYLGPTLSNQFDFLFSLNANRILDTGQHMHFLLSTIACLKPGGIAVHVFDFSDTHIRNPASNAVVRPQLERLVAHTLSHLNEVALLRFRHTEHHDTASSRPFGLIIRQGRPS